MNSVNIMRKVTDKK